MKNVGYICGILILILLIVGSTLDFVYGEDKEKIKVGIYQNDPLIFLDKDGNVKGIYAELLEYIASKENWSIEYKYGTTEECFKWLETGEIDIMGAVTSSPERTLIYSFSNEAVFSNWGMVFTSRNVQVNSFLDFKNMRVAVVKNNIYYVGPNGVKSLMERYEINCTFIELDSYDEVVQYLEADKADIGILNRLFQYQLGGHPNIKITPIVFYPVKLVFAFPKNVSKSEYLIERIDYNMKVLKEDPNSVYYSIIYKYLPGAIVSKETVEVFPTWGKWALLIAIISSILLYAVGMRNRTQFKEVKVDYVRLFNKMTEGFAVHKMMSDKAGNPVDYMYIAVNPKFEEITGLKAKDLIGKKQSEVQLKNQKDLVDIYGKVVKNGRPVEFEDYSKDLDRYYHITAYKTEGGRFATLVNDITKRKRMEETIANRTRQLEEANKELESFSYSVSHDLRAPLRSIDGFSKALLINYQDKLDDSGKDYLNRVRNASQKMGQLIDDMLKLSRITRKELVGQEVDMAQIAEAIINEMRTNDPQKIVKVSIEKGLKGNGDPDLIKVALTNLLSNSWKFTGKGEDARIEFGSIQDKGKKTYFIRDNGVGFDMKYADKLFQPFQRFHTQKEFSGNGVGLAIVHRIIKKHGGEIWAESEAGKGSTFYFRL